MSNVMIQIKSFFLFLFSACLLKVGFVQVVLPKLKLGDLKLNEFVAIFDFFSKQASPNKVINFHRENRLFPINQVKGHITCESVCCNSISKQYRQKVYYLLSLHFRKCVFNQSVTFLNHFVSLRVIS